jgi:hypothetical protein
MKLFVYSEQILMPASFQIILLYSTCYYLNFFIFSDNYIFFSLSDDENHNSNEKRGKKILLKYLYILKPKTIYVPCHQENRKMANQQG